MDYDFFYLKKFLVAHPLLDVSKLGEVCGVPEKTLLDFIGNGGPISRGQFQDIENEVYEYGYKAPENFIN